MNLVFKTDLLKGIDHGYITYQNINIQCEFVKNNFQLTTYLKGGPVKNQKATVNGQHLFSLGFQFGFVFIGLVKHGFLRINFLQSLQRVYILWINFLSLFEIR